MKWQGKDLLSKGPAVFSGEFVLDKSQLLDTFVSKYRAIISGCLMFMDNFIDLHQFTVYYVYLHF